MQRRSLLAALAAGTLSPLASSAHAQAWPSQPIRLVVPYPAGGGTDFFARQVAPAMGQALGTTLVVDNRPGASGMIGAQHVARQAPADGYTFLLGDMTTFAVNPTMFEKQQTYDIQKDLAPVTMTARFDFVLVVNPTVLPVRNLQELIAAASRAPEGLNYASPSIGTTHHLAMELLARETGMKLVAITYKGGGPAVQDLLGGQVGLMFLDRASARPHIDAGKLRPIAAAGARRIAAFPDLPTVAEQGLKGFDVEGWQGFMVRAGTPASVVKALNDAYQKTIASTELRRKLADVGIDVVGGPPEPFAQYVKAETARWRTVIQERHIKPE